MKIRLFIINVILLLVFFCSRVSYSSEAKKLRIVSLAPATTEILFALGLDEEIVGVSLFCNYPPKVKEKERVGTFSQPNIEKILSLRPDFIFCTGLEQEPMAIQLRQLNLKVCVSDPANLKELFASIKEIGRYTNREKEAEILIRRMQAGIEEISSQVQLVSRGDKPTVFIEIWHEPLMTAGRDSFIDELITLAGGLNIAYDTRNPYSYFSAEQVIKRNPACIILAYMYKEKPIIGVFKERLGWKRIDAVKNNRIYNDINPDLFLRPGPRLIEGLKEIYKRLYVRD